MKSLWWVLGAVIAAAFAVLIIFGYEIYQESPPIADRVVDAEGVELFSDGEILAGQDVWRTIGGQELGSVWGHGAYVAPDWTADWAHREAVLTLDNMAQARTGQNYGALSDEQQAAILVTYQRDLRKNTYDPTTGTITVSPLRAAAIKGVQAHFMGLFGDDPTLEQLRQDYAMPRNTVDTAERRRLLTAFFFWATWACVTERPGHDITYTNNWPPDDLTGNRPSGDLLIVSIVSFVFLLGGIGGLIWFYAATRDRWKSEQAFPQTDPLIGLSPTPSMHSTLKYFWIVALLILFQMAAGVITAHYGVEGTSFYGIPLADAIPYSLSRTWHLQLGLFWIATSWLATGLCLAPAISGGDPKFQRAGVNFLFVCLLVIVGGSVAGETLAIHQVIEGTFNFWFGHQGFEYLDLGRGWQIFLLVGLVLWLGLMVRGLWGAFTTSKGASKQLVFVFLLSSGAIAAFYGAGIAYGQDTNLSIAEYWRWWVVHLWVEAFFEIFAVVAIAFVFSRLGLIRMRSALLAVLFTGILYLAGGIIGLFHHLYFTGTTPIIMVLGGLFSALELMPLVIIGYEAYDNWKLAQNRAWIRHYKWPIYWFVAVAFWNLVGAGLFGFMINPPISLYYVQGLNTTQVHAHGALFGVYGMFGIGLTLLSLRLLKIDKEWKEGALRFSFWAMNIGVGLMIVLSLLPVGLSQAWASVEHGMWYARSAEFLQGSGLATLRWMRIPGDTLFAAGMLAFVYFVFGLTTGWSIRGKRPDSLTESPGPAE